MKTNREREQSARKRFLLALSGGFGLLNAVFAFNIIRLWPVYAEGNIETLIGGIVVTAGFGVLMLPSVAAWLDRLIHSMPVFFKVILFMPYGLVMAAFCGLLVVFVYFWDSFTTYWLGTVIVCSLAGVLIVLGFYIHWHRTIFSLTMQES